MIEYALLFGLGFVTALLAGLLFAPAIHRRIVKFTEDRIMATVPVSPQELRAQKDMVRAEMAASIARTGHDLKQERGKAATLTIKNDELIQQANRLYSESFDLRTAMEEMDTQAGELRSALRQEELRAAKLQETLAGAERIDREKESRIADLLHRIQRLTLDIDNLKIDIVTRDTEAESFRARINALRDERETLRNDLKLMGQRAKDAELRLAREENKSIRLEDRLNTEISGSVDKDTVIERRVSEINRLKERLKTANAEVRDATRSVKSGVTKPAIVRVKTATNSNEERNPPVEEKPVAPAEIIEAMPVAIPDPEPAALLPSRLIDQVRASELSEAARSQANAASDMLLNLQDESHDDTLRAEIADIAAKMVAVVAQREGISSPVRSMISGAPQQSTTGRVSLSERASQFMHQE